jgi:hypothetical protein
VTLKWCSRWCSEEWSTTCADGVATVHGQARLVRRRQLEQPTLEVPLLRVGAQREEVEDVGVLQGLLGEVGVGRRELVD